MLPPTSAFPSLLPATTWLCVGALALVTAVNMRGVTTSARLFIVPTAIFVLAVSVVVVVGLIRGGPAHPLPVTTHPQTVGAVGVLLVLSAFANGCAALTGVEAIANATPAFRSPGPVRARRAEATLGLVLGALLIGLAILIQRFDARPVEGRTLLSLVTQGSLGKGPAYVVVQMATVVLLALAANASFGGLPVLAARLAKDGHLPHPFALRANRMVHRYGVLVLAVLSGLLLVITEGRVDILVSMFAVGVFIGFTLCQIGMVAHWRRSRMTARRARMAVNGSGAVLTAAAAIVITATIFEHGAWLIVVIVPLLVVLFAKISATYDRIGRQIGVQTLPERPKQRETIVVVPVVA